jgi:hypothetical protein
VIRTIVLTCALVLGLAAAARALPPNETERLLLEPAGPAALRARLAAHAAEIEPRDREQAGHAWAVLGASARRAGLADSAIAALERAVALRGKLEDLTALADARLARGASGDAAAARALIEGALFGQEIGPDRDALLAREAAALEALGRPDSALALWRGLVLWAGQRPAWALRAGRALAASPPARDQDAAVRLILPLAVMTRGSDAELMGAVQRFSQARDIRQDLRAASAATLENDRADAALIAAFGGRALRVTAADGFVLGAAAFPSGGRGRARAAVVLTAPGEPFAANDSLIAVLRSTGHAVVLVSPRGSGGSVGPGCTGPWAWPGREDALTAACARDLRAAVRALAEAFPCDTARLLLVAAGASAPAAAQAVAEDPRVAAVALASPLVEPAARGPVLHHLTLARVPVFVQLAPEDLFSSFDLSDALFRAGALRSSRVSESRSSATGAAQWREDADSRARLKGWIEEARRVPRATPRPRRR